jgi:hypothetical protein
LQKNYSYRTIIAFYLTLVYTVIIFKPVLPIVSDAFAHTFAEAIHIATVHAIYGENHLQKELANTNADDKSKSQNISKTEDLITAHVCPVECHYVYHERINKSYTALILPGIEDIFLANDAPPPKFC